MVRLFETLKKAGFSDYQARAYSILVAEQRATAITIARKANIPSSKIYEVMHSLIHRGYAAVIKEHPLTFVANDIKAVLKEELKVKINNLKVLDQEINEIELPKEPASQFSIIYGKDAFFTKVKTSVRCSNKQIVAVVNSFKIDKALVDSLRDFMAAGGIVLFLGPIKKENMPRIRELRKAGVQIKHFIPESTRFTVWDEKIVTIALKDNGGRDYQSLWVDNEFLGKTLTKHFMELWKKA